MTEVQQRRYDITDSARGTQNIVSGSFSQHPHQSLSLSSNRERMAAPSSVVEHNLAVAANDRTCQRSRTEPGWCCLAPPLPPSYASALPDNVILMSFLVSILRLNQQWASLLHFQLWSGVTVCALRLAQSEFVVETHSPRANLLTHCTASDFCRT